MGSSRQDRRIGYANDQDMADYTGATKRQDEDKFKETQVTLILVGI